MGKQKLNILTYCLAFLLPALIMLLVFAENKVSPFGRYSLLAMDLNEQYIHFFFGLKRILVGEESFLYTWNTTLGSQFVSLFAYYLSSPLNLAFAAVPDSWMLDVVTFITLVKIGLCGLSMAICLCTFAGGFPNDSAQPKVFGQNNFVLIGLSTLYALNAFVIAFGMCLMWMDSVMLLPLAVVGVALAVNRGKFKVLFWSIFLCCFANYYTAYMVCIFLSLFIFCYVICSVHASFIERLKSLIATYCCCALGAGSAAFVLLPNYYSLSDGKLASSSFKLNWKTDQLLEVLEKYLSGFEIGQYTSITHLGNPYFYMGIGTCLLTLVALLTQSVAFRIKACFLALSLFVFISFGIDALNVAWHGFQPPIWFPFRYSFLLPFLFCLFAVVALKREPQVFKVRHCIGLFTFVMLVSFYVLSKGSSQQNPASSSLSLLYAVAYLIVFVSTFFAHRVRLFSYSRALVGILLLSEAYLNARAMYAARVKEFPNKEKTEFYSYFEKHQKVLSKAHLEEGTLWRVEVQDKYSRNDSFTLGYKGLTHYSSAFSFKGLQFFRNLGMLQKHIFVQYEGSTPFLDFLFGLRFVVAKQQPIGAFQKVYEQNGLGLYENADTAPFAFALRSPDSSELWKNSLTHDGPFRNQNFLFKQLAPEVEGELFGALSEVSIDPLDQLVRFRIPEARAIFADVGPSFVVSSAQINGKLLPAQEYVGTVPLMTQQEALENSVQGGEFKIQRASPHFPARVEIFAFDEQVFRKGVASMQREGLSFYKKSSTLLEGDLSSGSSGWFLASMPFDPGWKAELIGSHGEKQDLVTATAFGYLLSFRVPETVESQMKEGKRFKIRLSFWPKGLDSGIFIAVLCAASAGSASFVRALRGRRSARGLAS